jgi:hypothetical protein
MSLQKVKNLIKNIRLSIDKKAAAWHIPHSVLPFGPSIAIILFGLFVYGQLSPGGITNKLSPVGKTIITTNPLAQPKIIKPASAAPSLDSTLPTTVSQASPVATTAPTHSSKPQPVVTPAPTSNVSGLAPTTPSSPSNPQTTGYTSTNWSGYLATNGSFTGISASWDATLATGDGVSTSADGTWVGIGGVSSGDLIQVGTQNTIFANGHQSTSAFYELLPAFSQPVLGMTVSEGDSISASIVEISAGSWTIHITDNTDAQSYSTTVSYSSSLSSAEWIEEDPSFGNGSQIPFDNFNNATFTLGTTILNGSSVNIQNSNALPVTMVNNSDQPIAVPSALSGGASFSISP